MFEADSDSALTKRLAALLVHGLLNMLKLMQIKGLQVCIEAENGGHLVGEASSLSSKNLVKSSSLSSTADGSVGNSNVGLSSEVGTTDSESGGTGTGEKESNSSVIGSRGERIKDTLEREPIELQVEYVSYQHAGHAGNRGNEGEKHFNVKVVSKEFEGKSMVWRHRLIYNRSCSVDYTDCRLWQRLPLKLMVDEVWQ